jgi:riboflavin kinase/FMN adenylyltransferase
MWYSGKVLKGSQDGRKIGFPTVNLSPALIPPDTKQGVYSSKIKYKNNVYVGALYFGPRLVKNETFTVLEIHILDFDKDLYNKQIEFTINTFIRGVMDFSEFDALKAQLEKDIAAIKNLDKP